MQQLDIRYDRRRAGGGNDLRKIFSKKFENMNGYTFLVATLPYSPHVWKNDDGTYGGYEIELMKKIGEQRNFRYAINPPPDGSWGAANEEGVWSGLIGHSLYGHTNW